MPNSPISQFNNVASGASFGGGGKAVNPSSPVGGAATASGHQGMSTWGNNDNSRVDVSGAGLSGIAGASVAVMQVLLAEAQYALARRYYDTNKLDFYFYQDHYQVPFIEHKNEAFNAPTYNADYFPMTGASLGRVKAYDEKWFQTRRRLHRYNVGQGMHVDYSFYMGRRKATMTSFVAGRRIEDARKDWKDDQAHTHKVQALNFGITAGNIARQGLASATKELENAYDEMGSRIGGLSNGLSRFGGYKAGRQAGDAALNDAATSGANMAPHATGTGPD